MDQVKRQRPGAEMRRAIMARFAQSGLAVDAFCRREPISASSFYRWRSLLGGSSGRDVVTSSPSSTARAAVDFVDLGTAAENS